MARKKRRTENPATSERAAERDLGEIVGSLKEGDTVLRRGSDEIREGTRLKVSLTSVSKG